MERIVRGICIVGIIIVGMYIGVKLWDRMPETRQRQIATMVEHVTKVTMGEVSLLLDYICEAPKQVYHWKETIKQMVDGPFLLSSYIQESSLVTQNSGQNTFSTVESSEEMSSTQSFFQQEETKETASVSCGAASIPSGTSIITELVELQEISGISVEQMLNYSYLIENFYTIDSSCSMTQELLNPIKLLSKELAISKETNGPQILIYHTHSQEAYIDSVEGQREHTIVGVGDYLTELLTKHYGYQVLHDTGIYDMENGNLERSQAYNRALPAITAILEQYPTIEVVIDLHRDGVAEDVHLVTDVNGKPTARIMLFNGVCRNQQGDLPELVHPYRQDNLAISLQLGLHLKALYPNVFRTIYCKQSRYNQHLVARSLLIEVGAQTNTVQEAMNAMEVLAELLNRVLA